MNNLEFIKEVASRSSNSIEAICANWLPDGAKKGKEWVALNPKRSDGDTGSFSVSLETGLFADFASGDSGHDPVDLVAWLDGLTKVEAAKSIAEFLFLQLDQPAPAAKKKTASKPMATRPDKHPKLGAPSMQWEYRSASGELVTTVWRFETADGKTIRPLTKVEGGWRWGDPEGVLPLYRLDQLTANPATPMVVTEGEKAADAAAVMFPDSITTTSMHGAGSPHKTDWSPVAGRAVRIWPDADKSGARYAAAVAKLALAAGAVSVEVLDVSAWCDGFDAADVTDWQPHDAVWVPFSVGSVGSVGLVQDENTLQAIDNAGSVGSVGFSQTISLESEKERVLAAIALQLDDAGAVFEPEVIAAWNYIYDNSVADYQRLRAAAKKAGALVIEIDKVCDLRNRRVISGKQKSVSTNIKQSYTSYTSCTNNNLERDNPTLNLHSTYIQPTENYTKPTLPTLDLPAAPNALVVSTEKGDRRLVESKAALVAARALHGSFALDAQSELWHSFTGSHWEPCIQPTKLHQAFTRWMYPATGDLGFTPGYQNGILTLVQRANSLPLPLARPDTVPFKNGLLSIQNKTLEPITPENAQTWCLPYSYEPTADCPHVKAWLLDAVDGDVDTVELLRAFLAALIRGGAYLQRFLHLVGCGGSGKSTYLRLAAALIGEDNAVSTDLKELEQNRFESASLYGKRLALITDSDKYGGSINKLKAITGQDPIRLERKHIQQAGTFVFEGLVFIASNEALTTTDYTSAVERRRVTVQFDKRVSESEKQKWRQAGGETAWLHSELPGVVNWCLAMSVEEMERLIANPPERTAQSNMDAMRSGNPAADWLLECCTPAQNEWTGVGIKDELREKDTGRVYFESADSKLYPNYLSWCLGNGREPLSLRRFRGVVIDLAKSFGHAVQPTRLPQGQGIKGLKLNAPGAEPFNWLRPALSQPALSQPALPALSTAYSADDDSGDDWGEI